MWLRTGNVNVASGSPTVNGGSSTPNFITNGAKPGYAFIGPDNRTYEILAVVSETQITLATNYGSSTLSNQAYQIAQMSVGAYAALLTAVQNLITMLSTSIIGTTAKFGSPVEASAVLAALGTLVSLESNASLNTRLSKNATGNDVILEFAVARSGRARLGLIGNNNIVLQYSTDGSAWTTVFTFDITTAPSNPRLALNFPLIPKIYTIATLPTSVAGMIIWVSDLGGGAGPLMGDGTGWKRLEPGYQTISTNANETHTELVNAGDIRHTGTLTADRTITLSTTNARPGAERDYTRTGSGAFNLSIGGLKNLVQNTWCRVKFDGSAWYLAGYGAL